MAHIQLFVGGELTTKVEEIKEVMGFTNKHDAITFVLESLKKTSMDDFKKEIEEFKKQAGDKIQAETAKTNYVAMMEKVKDEATNLAKLGLKSKISGDLEEGRKYFKQAKEMVEQIEQKYPELAEVDTVE